MKLLVNVFVGTFFRCKFIAAALTQQKTAEMEAVKCGLFHFSCYDARLAERTLLEQSQLFLSAAAVCGLSKQLHTYTVVVFHFEKLSSSITVQLKAIIVIIECML